MERKATGAASLCAETLLSLFRAQHVFRPEIHSSLSSTNDRVRSAALAGEAAGLLVLAETQTAGRGRQGRAFFSPGGTGVYMSLLLRPETLEHPERITAAAAVAVARAVEDAADRPAGIKWVNDVFLQGRKVAGILTEGGVSPNGRPWAALGIGINLLPPDGGFPSELDGIAAAVFPNGGEVSRERLIARVAEDFLTLYEHWDAPGLLREYRSRNILKDRKVYITQNGEDVGATVLDIAEDFGLLLQTDTGAQLHLRSGEARVRPEN